MQYPILADLHTHSIASGHGTTDTITDLARAASHIPLQFLGISDHAPAYLGAAHDSYFRNLRYSAKERFHVSMLYGVELNILNCNGDVDLEEDILLSLNYAIISMHHPLFSSGTAAENTTAYINAMRHARVRFIGHPDDETFPVDFYRLLTAAKDRHVYPELNNHSLMPDSYRKQGQQNSRTILSLCKELDLPVLLSSDSHGKDHIADVRYILPLLEEYNFPASLIINCNPSLLRSILLSPDENDNRIL